MKNYTMRLCFLMVSTITNVTMAMQRDMSDTRVYVKNSSVGLTNNTYDIYAEMIPTLNASRSLLHPEILIPYGEMKVIGMFDNIDDIKIRGSSAVSCWAYNKAFLDNIRQDMERKYGSFLGNSDLQLIVTAGISGFYISYYNWIVRNSPTSSGVDK